MKLKRGIIGVNPSAGSSRKKTNFFKKGLTKKSENSIFKAPAKNNFA